MISKKPPPDDMPGGIIDLWEPTPVRELTDQHVICVLGVELKVRDCRPAERGGDFFTLEATKIEKLPHGGMATGIVVVQVDRNRLVPARITDDSAGGRTPSTIDCSRHHRHGRTLPRTQ